MSKRREELIEKLTSTARGKELYHMGLILYGDPGRLKPIEETYRDSCGANLCSSGPFRFGTGGGARILRESKTLS